MCITVRLLVASKAERTLRLRYGGKRYPDGRPAKLAARRVTSTTQNPDGHEWWNTNYEERNSRSSSQTAARSLRLHSARARAQTRGQGQPCRLPRKRTAPPFPVAAVADRGYARARQAAAVPAGASRGAVDCRATA